MRNGRYSISKSWWQVDSSWLDRVSVKQNRKFPRSCRIGKSQLRMLMSRPIFFKLERSLLSISSTATLKKMDPPSSPVMRKWRSYLRANFQKLINQVDTPIAPTFYWSDICKSDKKIIYVYSLKNDIVIVHIYGHAWQNYQLRRCTWKMILKAIISIWIYINSNYKKKYEIQTWMKKKKHRINNKWVRRNINLGSYKYLYC